MITEPALPPRRGAHLTACGTLAPMFVARVERCRQWVADVLGEVEGYGDVFGTNVSEVENRSRDGFIAFTDGGFDGIAYATLDAAHGAGCAPAVIQTYIDRALNDVEESWLEKYPDRKLELLSDDPEWREEYWEFENESMREGGTYFYKVRVLFHGDQHDSESGEPEALFCVGINTDFEYGRDYISWLPYMGGKAQQTQWVWERTVKIKDLTPRRIESLTRQAIKALAKA